MADLPAGGAAALYPDGGNNPAGNIGAIVDPTTGAPKYSPAAAATPEVVPPVTAPAPADLPAPAEPKIEAAPAPAEPPKEGEPAPLDVAAYDALKLPETMTVAEPVFAEFKTLAAELKLAPEAVEKKLFPFAEKLLKGQVEAIQTAASAEFTRQQEAWVSELKSMPEFQGEALERNTTFLGRLMDEFGSPEARAYLDSTGAGNNPAIVKMLLSMGQALIEGDPTPIGDPGSLARPKQDGKQAARTPGGILYPSMQN